MSQAVLELGLGGSVTISLDILHILEEARGLKRPPEVPAGPAVTLQTLKKKKKIIQKTHLVSLFEAQAKVNELEALVVGAPEDVARLQVSMDVTLPVEEGESLQDISGTVLNEPHRVALLGPAEKPSQCDGKDGTLMLFSKPLKFKFCKNSNSNRQAILFFCIAFTLGAVVYGVI